VRAANSQVLYVAPQPAKFPAPVAPAKHDADADVKVDVIAGNDEAHLDPVEQDMRNKLEPVLKKELAFATRVCQLDKTQRKTLADAGAEALKKAAYQYTQAQQHAIQPRIVIFNGGRNVVPAQTNPIKILQDALVAAAAEKLPTEMSKQLADEFTKRAQYRQQAVIDSLVVMLDKKLALTEQQRKEISDSLAANWEDSWAPQLQIFMYEQDMFPPLPDKCIVPHLLPSQKTVWENLPNRNVQFAVDAFEIDPLTNGIDLSDSADDP
jgi:hypothetical protein